MKYLLLSIIILGVASCNTYSVLHQFEKDPEGMDEIAMLLEEGEAEEAQSEILKQVPSAAGKLLTSETLNFSDDSEMSDYITDLAASMAGVSNGEQLLSIYATAEAQTAGVVAIDFITDLVIIDAEQPSSSLYLDSSDDEDAIQRFYPAMPTSCNNDAAPVQFSLDKAMAIVLATAILKGFDPDDVLTEIRKLRASVSDANLLNNAIFSIVAFICPAMSYDTDGDTIVSEAESLEIADEDAVNFYERSSIAIDSVQAMVDVNSNDKNLAKALARMEKYRDMIDDMDSELSLANKVRGFLVSQSDR